MDYSSFSRRAAEVGVTLPGEPPPIELREPSIRNVEAHDNGEDLVDAGRDLRCLGCYHAVGWPGTSATTHLRLGVVTRLLEIQMDLPDGFGLAVFDGWRSRATVSALYAHYYGPGSTLEPGYLAEPDDRAVPPHLTGGAVDLTLTWHGTPLELGSPFDEFTPRSPPQGARTSRPHPRRTTRPRPPPIARRRHDRRRLRPVSRGVVALLVGRRGVGTVGQRRGDALRTDRAQPVTSPV